MKFPVENDPNIEMIGHVKLDLHAYSGTDIYSDGEIEDRLLEIARDRSPVEYQQIIEESASWPILYHLSELRANIVEWLPMDKNTKVLEVGAGCGAITGALARKAGSVTCCDLSLKRSRINAYRHMYDDNIVIHVGNFTDVEKDLDNDFDVICLIGVFEYAQSYVDQADPYTGFLKLIGSHLKKGGYIAIAIENRFGLKYWAGCKEDHLGRYFASVEGYPDGGVVRTFTDKKLTEIARESGFKDIHMYYPYPDYKFMTDLYSDKRLPRQGELKNNIRNFDNDRLMLFNEKDAFDSILDEGLFNLYSNSYMMILGPEPDVYYARYSNDRARDYRIVTTIGDCGAGGGSGAKKQVIKRALSPEATTHLKRMADAYEKLNQRYSGKECRISINKAELSEDGMTLTLDYVKGVSLESMLDECLFKGDTEGFTALFKDYLERVGYGEGEGAVTDIDLIFSNILVDGDDWTIIDYEWTTSEVWPAAHLGFRAIYCYIMEDERRNKFSFDLIISLLKLNSRTIQDLRDQEMEFQKTVTGRHKSLAEIRDLIGFGILSPDGGASGGSEQIPADMRPQIYEDTGRGFNEEESYFAEGFPFAMEIPEGRKALRIDPCMDFCLVSVEEIGWNGAAVPLNRMHFSHNGVKLGHGLYAFATTDPGFTISLKGLKQEKINRLDVNMSVTPLTPEIAGRLAK